MSAVEPVPSVPAPPVDPAGRGHVCWVVDDDASFLPTAREMLRRGAADGAKTAIFAPLGSPVLDLLAGDARLAIDPRHTVLGGGPLDAEAMFRMFRAQADAAEAEGHHRLCVVADMDWLRPLDPSSDDVVGFELSLDRVVAELDATVICAYRTKTFHPAHIEGTMAVHPRAVGTTAAPQFRFVADGDRWRLSGEIDVAVRAAFRAALSAAAVDDPCTVDVSGLDFIDGAGLRQIAEVAGHGRGRVVLQGASPLLRRLWGAADLAAQAPAVELEAA